MSEFKLDPKRTAVVVIDLQKGIAAIPGGAPHSKPAVIANCARLLSAARAAGAQPVLVHVGVSSDGADRPKTPTDQPMRTHPETCRCIGAEFIAEPIRLAMR